MKFTDRQKAEMERLRRRHPDAHPSTIRYVVMTDSQRAMHWCGETLKCAVVFASLLAIIFILLTA